jgi:hypothetical protein
MMPPLRAATAAPIAVSTEHACKFRNRDTVREKVRETKTNRQRMRQRNRRLPHLHRCRRFRRCVRISLVFLSTSTTSNMPHACHCRVLRDTQGRETQRERHTHRGERDTEQMKDEKTQKSDRGQMKQEKRQKECSDESHCVVCLAWLVD